MRGCFYLLDYSKPSVEIKSRALLIATKTITGFDELEFKSKAELT